MSSPQPPSLRDLYAPSSSAWSFTPPANASQPEIPSSAASTYQWSTRPSQHALFGLGPSGYDDGGFDIASVLQGVVTSVMLKYAGTAVALPWEVGKTLLQVQWVPRSSEAPEVRDFVETDERNDDDALSDTSAEHDSYFADPQAEPPSRPPRRPTDEKGYIVRQSVTDEATIPHYVIPVGSAAGASGMMFRLKNFEPEGWLSLWKGLLTSTVTDILTDLIRPVMRAALEALLSPTMPSLNSPLYSYTPPPLFIPVASNIITGFVLSPLDLIRTRLIVQSADPRHRMYKGPLDALDQILEQEGGFGGMYFHPHLLIPTVLDCTLRGVVPFVLPALIASYFRISHETHPFTRNILELTGNCASLLITLPVETVRRRLQVQTRGAARPFKGCVELRPAPYNGMVDAFWHILTEERSDLPLRPKRQHRRKSEDKKEGAPRAQLQDHNDSSSWLRHSGIGQLYRGLSLRVGASVVVFVLAMFAGEGEPDAGWAEL